MTTCTACGGRGRLPAERRVTSGGRRKTLPAALCTQCGGLGQAAVDCPHGDDPTTCPPCQTQATTITSTPTVLARSTAIHPTTCLQCDQPIRHGDPIVLTDDGPPWTHEDCR